MRRVAVVVVHFGAPGPTVACIATLRADPSQVERRVVVVDNSGGLDPATLGTEVAVVTAAGNLGFGAGVNLGVEALGSVSWDALVVLNHDVEVRPGFLSAAVEAVSAPGVGAASGPLFLDSERRRLWYAGGGVDFLTGTVRQSRRLRDVGRERDVSFLPGAAIVFAWKAFHGAGGFDPRFFLYHEDLDICMRLRRRGWRLRFVPALEAVHRLGAATGSDQLSPLYLESLSRTRLRAFRPLAYRLYLAVLHSGYVAVRAGTFALLGGRRGRERAVALLRGHRAALAGILSSPTE